MILQQDIDASAARITAAMHTAYGGRGKSLTSSLRRAGRLMTKYLHAQAQQIVDAQKLGGNPRLLCRLDAAALANAERLLLDHLKAVDAADRRKGVILGILGVIAFNLLVVATGFIIWLVWAGYV